MITYPKDGVSYGIEATGIVKNAKNMDAAKKFVDWAASKKFADFIVANKITTFRHAPMLRPAILCSTSPKSI